jgi:glycosyltransferase involved in cell wall biosynthesis
MSDIQTITSREIELSIVLPCLNEERTVGLCVAQAKAFLTGQNIRGEVLVADNGSTDRSVEFAASSGASVIHVPEKGYGNALKAGFQAARGKYIIMADADASYDLLHLMPFVEQLRCGYDLVMGNRFRGGIQKGAMPWHHRYIGNPVLSFVGQLFFQTPAKDFHCGLRGFTREAMERMNLQTTGMELASEIVIKASILGMKVCEVPTTLSPDGRDRPPHLRSFRDGWRHLRFLLIYSPRWLFFYPGLLLVIVGLAFSIILSAGPLHLPFHLVDFHSFIVAGTLVVLGMNILSFYAITHVYAFYAGLLPKPPIFTSLFKVLNLEKGLLLGSIFFIIGVGILLFAARLSQLPGGFETIGFGRSVRLVFGGSLNILLGTQIIFTSFVLSMLGMNARR